MNNKKIVVLAVQMEEVNVVVNFLDQKFGVDKVVFEEKISKAKLLKGRIKKLGWFTVFGQLLFQVFCQIPLRKLAKNRILSIIKSEKLDTNAIANDKIRFVESVNSDYCIALLKELSPDLIFVAGTRIISKKVLQAFPNTIFINVHAGITPAYRGVHGAYWALYADDAKNCGVTVHYVDAGIDTGGILAQTTIKPTPNDNFCTYPWLQLAACLPLLADVLEKVFANQINVKTNQLPSRLWYHPTIWQYLHGRILKAVK